MARQAARELGHHLRQRGALRDDLDAVKVALQLAHPSVRLHVQPLNRDCARSVRL